MSKDMMYVLLCWGGTMVWIISLFPVFPENPYAPHIPRGSMEDVPLEKAPERIQ